MGVYMCGRVVYLGYIFANENLIEEVCAAAFRDVMARCFNGSFPRFLVVGK